jgi:hypothetical protein
LLGLAEGAAEGLADGEVVGLLVGDAVGLLVGLLVGEAVGFFVGEPVGALVGEGVVHATFSAHGMVNSYVQVPTSVSGLHVSGTVSRAASWSMVEECTAMTTSAIMFSPQIAVMDVVVKSCD